MSDVDVARRDGTRRRRQIAIALWSVACVAALFVEAILRLGGRGCATVAAGLDAGQLLALGAMTFVLCYVEGYRSLQRRFAPAVVHRAFEVGARARGVAAILTAPLYSLSLFGGTRREMRRAWFGVALIAVAIAIVRALPPPWRGMVDAAVAAALAWGLLAMMACCVRAVTGTPRQSSDRKEDVGAMYRAKPSGE